MSESSRIGLIASWFGLGGLVIALLMQGGVMAQPGKTVLAQPHADDSSVAASPVEAEVMPASLKVGTVLQVQMAKGLDSSSLHAGDSLNGKLAGPVLTSEGQTIAAGTRVMATVVSTATAGKIASAGEFSLQVTKVGAVAVVSDVLSFEGEEGRKDLPNSAPAKGTEATVPVGQMLTFHVAKQK